MKLPVSLSRFLQGSTFPRILPVILIVLALPVTVFVMQQQQNLRQQAAGTTCTFAANRVPNKNDIASTVTITNQGGYDRVEWNADKHRTSDGTYLKADSDALRRYGTLATNFASYTHTNLPTGHTYKMFAEIYSDSQQLPAILCTPEKWIEITGSTTTNPTATPPTVNCSQSPKPNSCTCTINSNCQSNFCNAVGGTKVCYPAPTATPTTSSGGTVYNITGYVWKDTDGDGQIETSAFGGTETYFSGVNVYAQQNGSTVKQASSNSNGEFTLSGLSAGTYSVYVTEPSGWSRTTTEPVSVTVGPSKGTKFGLRQTSTAPTATKTPTPTTGAQVYSIQGSVFKDTNGDGVKNNGETSFPNVRVDVLNGNGFFVKSATTNNLGSYFMEVNAAGQYKVQILNGAPAGWTLTTQNNVSVTLTTTNKLANVPPFGMRQTSSTVATPTFPAGTDCNVSTNKPNGCLCADSNQCLSTSQCASLNFPGFENQKTCIPNSSSSNSTQLALSLSVGDAVAANTVSSQEVTVELFDTSGALVKEVSGTVTLDGASGIYSGTINAGNITTGNYSIKAKLVNSLRALIGGGNRSLYANTLNTLPETPLIMGDANNDNQITLADFSILFDCYNNVDSCQEAQQAAADFYVDDTIDILDYNIFLNGVQNNPTGE